MSASVDPVRGLMHQHRELCEHAVDPLEIAAGLEAHGVTDRTAARFRHRDVFSLAEELYARVPRAQARARLEPGGTRTAGPTADRTADPAAVPAVDRTAAPAVDRAAVPAPAPWRRCVPRPGRAALPLLPGALCASALGALALVPDVPPFAPLTVVLMGTVAVLAGARFVLREVPLPRGAALAVCWLAGFALCGDRLLADALSGGPDLPDLGQALLTSGVPEVPEVPEAPVVSGTALGLALGVAPAVWCARWFAVRARRRLGVSASLEEFAAGVRPLLVAAVALFALTLLGAQSAARAVAGALHAAAPYAGAGPLEVSMALGVLLFAALLLAAHGFGHAASAGLAVACGAEALALASAFAARLPVLGVLGSPVEAAVAACGTYAVAVTACACAALGLLAYAARALTGASAHHRATESV